MATHKPFLIRHADGREYELAGDKAGIALYRDEYQHQGFALVDPQPHTHERPDLGGEKVKSLDEMTRAELEAVATERGIENPSSFKTKAELLAAITSDGDDADEDTDDGAAKRGTTDADTGAGDGKSGSAVHAADGDAGGK